MENLDPFKLDSYPGCSGMSGQLVFVILDGVGIYRGRAEGYDANAFDLASTPNLDRLFGEAQVSLRLQAHGTAVGLPSDSDMGNSEVGHNAMGAGRIFEQGAKLVNQAIASDDLFAGQTWQQLVQNVRTNRSTFHFIGLLSDGNVHSHIEHLEALVQELANEGVKRLRIHALADGRDVDPVSFHLFIERIEEVCRSLAAKGVDAKIASGGGRMRITMDRYNADWEMVQRGWEAHVLGKGRTFSSATKAVGVFREEQPGVIDQDLPPFVITDETGKPVGTIENGDSVVFFNFRGDRAIEISRAFTQLDLQEFDRIRVPDVVFAGMMEYDGDLKIPPNYLVSPPAISRTVSEYLVHNGISQLAVAETQKFGHVTYFWNGNNSAQFDENLEEWVEIPSDSISFDEKPQMKAREVCQVVVDDLQSNKHRFVRVNFANGDMVGHTGNLQAAVQAMEIVDECVARIEAAAIAAGATMVITADHGNLDMMWEVEKSTGEIKRDSAGDPVLKTSHTLSPVPWCLSGANASSFVANEEVKNPGLGNIAATLLVLLGFQPPADYLPPLVVPRS